MNKGVGVIRAIGEKALLPSGSRMPRTGTSLPLSDSAQLIPLPLAELAQEFNRDCLSSRWVCIYKPSFCDEGAECLQIGVTHEMSILTGRLGEPGNHFTTMFGTWLSLKDSVRPQTKGIASYCALGPFGTDRCQRRKHQSIIKTTAALSSTVLRSVLSSSSLLLFIQNGGQHQSSTSGETKD